jgi:hypothetical protein
MNGEEIINQLNEPSRVLAEVLFHRFPDWISFAKVCGGPGLGTLIIEAPSPVTGRDQSLGVEDRGNAFEASYRFHHPPHPLEAHFTFGPGEERDAAAEVVQWLAEIVEERVVLVEERAGLFPWSRGTGFTLVAREELTEQPRRKPISVFSWRGTFDMITGRTEGS